jgi:predicted membrane-bound spermidine synthase
MYSYTLTFKEDVDRLTAPEQEITLQRLAQAGDVIILSDGSRYQVMFVAHRAQNSSLYLDKGVRVPQS